MDPENAHKIAHFLIRWAGNTPLRGLASNFFDISRCSSVQRMGITFPSRFGLAAGFDKDASAIRGLSMLGFGFVEVGTVTAHAQPGNERPRLWRRVEERALINRMGFNNHGAAAAAVKLRRLRRSRTGRNLIVGVNIGKTKAVPETEAIADYVISARLLAPYADYVVVNVSSPNTPGLRSLQAVASLRPLLEAVKQSANDAAGRHVPLLVKIAPDLNNEDVREIASMVNELDVAGVVAVNTTINHDHGVGGLSGEPLQTRGVEVVSLLRQHLETQRTIIGVGGITTASDAQKYLHAGADLLQGYSAFIYQGPSWPSQISRSVSL